MVEKFWEVEKIWAEMEKRAFAVCFCANCVEMAEKLAKFKAEAAQFNKKKLLETIEDNMEFHEWMEKHRKLPGVAGSILNELDMHQLDLLGAEPGIIHPFACKSSPYFNNFTKDFMIEVKNPTPEQRPFKDINNLQLIEVSNKDSKEIAKA